MDWLAENWVWVLFAAAFFAMHLFGHGGHGGHGAHGGHGSRGRGGCGGRRDDDRESSDRREDQPRPTHQH